MTSASKMVADDDHIVVIWTRTGQRADDSLSSDGVVVYHVDRGENRRGVGSTKQYALDIFCS